MMEVTEMHSNAILAVAQAKIKPIDDIISAVQGNCIFTKGVFDLLHYGHLSLFQYMGQLKSQTHHFTVVSITSDQRVKEKKGINRPINPENERAIQIALLPQIDYVFINNNSNYSVVISQIQPKIFVKGMDTAGSNTDLLKANPEFQSMSKDSQVVIFSDDGVISTSTIIERVKKSAM